MEPERYGKLLKYLTVRAKEPDVIPLALDGLEPFLRLGEGDRYPLTYECDVSAWDIGEAIVAATGYAAGRIEFVSNSAWLEKEEGADDELPLIRSSYEEHLWTGFGRAFKTGLSATTRRTLKTVLKRYFLGTLWDSAWRTFDARLARQLLPQGGAIDTLLIFLGLVLADDRGEIARIMPLVDVLARGAIPLGVKKDEPGTWLVLVA
jgi:hypothetical protein